MMTTMNEVLSLKLSGSKQAIDNFLKKIKSEYSTLSESHFLQNDRAAGGHKFIVVIEK